MTFTTLLCGLLTNAVVISLTDQPEPDSQFEWNQDAEQALVEIINDGAYGTVTSILILEDSEIVAELYFNGAGPQTLHNTRSVTKTVTSMAVGLAIRDGHLTIDANPADFFSELAPFDHPDPRKLSLTVEDLLTMSSQMECNDWTQFSRGNEERMYLVEDWNSFFWDLPIRGYPSWSTPPSGSPYGRSFSYCTAGVQILGETVQRAVGVDFTTYVQAELFDPLGIGAHQWPITGLGQVHMGGGLLLNTQDLAKLGDLYQADGVWNEHRILPEAWVEDSFTSRAEISESLPGWRYGYLWWLIPYEVGGQTYYAPSMNGNGGNRVFVLPDWGITVVFTNTDYNNPQMNRNADQFFRAEIVSRLLSHEILD